MLQLPHRGWSANSVKYSWVRFSSNMTDFIRKLKFIGHIHDDYSFNYDNCHVWPTNISTSKIWSYTQKKTHMCSIKLTWQNFNWENRSRPRPAQIFLCSKTKLSLWTKTFFLAHLQIVRSSAQLQIPSHHKEANLWHFQHFKKKSVTAELDP